MEDYILNDRNERVKNTGYEFTSDEISYIKELSEKYRIGSKLSSETVITLYGNFKIFKAFDEILIKYPYMIKMKTVLASSGVSYLNIIKDLKKPEEFNDIINNDSDIITICGSMKYYDTMLDIQEKLTLSGDIVFIPVKIQSDRILTDIEKERLISSHYNKIALSNIVFIINEDDYIGQDTRNEIDYAKSLNKNIIYLQ